MTPPIVKRYLVALNRYKWVGLAGFVVVFGISGVVAFQQPEAPPVNYKAEGTLAYKNPPVTFSTIGTQIQQEGQALSKDLLLAGNLVEAAAAKASADPKQVRLKAEVKVPKQGESNLLPVIYIDTDQQRAITVVQALMEEMVEQSRLINTSRVRAIIQSINQRLPQVSQELRTAEQKLENYDRQEGVALLAAQNGSLIGGITGSEEQQRQLRLTLDGIDAQIRNLEQRLGLSTDQAYASSALSADPIIANLRSQIYQTESQLESLRKSLRPGHPTMVQLQQQQQAYEQLLQARAAEVIGGGGITAPLPSGNQVRKDSTLDPARQQLANTLVGLRTQRDAIAQQLKTTRQTEQELRRAYANIPNKQLERARIEQQVVLKKAFYDQMQAKLVDARAAEVETVSSLSIAKPPEIIESTTPTTVINNPYVTLGVGALVGLLVGGGLIFLLGTLEGKFYTLEDVRGALRLREVPLLGILPLIRGEDLQAEGSTILVKAESPYLEFYERFRSNLNRAGDRSLRIVALTSTVHYEGKTTSAYNLAIASARAGKRTLLVEADLRSPSQAQLLKVASDPESAVEPLRYYGQLGECIRLVPEIENLYIVPSPGPQQQAAAILESSEMRRLLEDVRGRFDLVILDTPSLSRCNDALLLEPYTDGIVLVTRPGYTEDSLLTEAVEQLTESEELLLLGAVINGTDIHVPLPEEDENLETQLRAEEREHRQDMEEVGTRTRNF